ncbi:DUF935 family protein [Apibacter muscae]|uniref:phage portal protein family protein n=1 Tax=Apibacter muscae TaxID=2509004 RepID=UPI0011ABDFEE|nr:DUF935 family protein [Apibacter muscae]TWP31244.1 DUF935 family protein [Apibacter muscae]
MSKKRRHNRRPAIQQPQAQAEKKSNYLSSLLVPQEISIHAKSINDYKIAVALALDNSNPDRSPLAALYDNLLLDNHVASVIDSRILYSQRSPFKMIDDKGNENEELSWLLERSWFEELIRLVLFSKFQGTTLLELYETNAEGELATTTEIPQSHFNATKGLILKEPGATNGWQYKEGIFKNYYVQIGKDRDLGILERLAPMILAKKIGWGAWMDFIDKYGVPPLFITTDREDNSRLQQLYSSAMAFKSNSFLIGRGNEKFEVGSTHTGNSKDTFDVFIERANDEISKRILGGSSLTDQKTFVGSAQIQYRLAEDRYNADKIFFKNIFNSFIRPRLINLSPIYAPLQNHYFEWDNSEVRTADGVADLVVKLSQAGYVPDPEFVEQETGIKLLGLKENTIVKPQPEAEKKK